MAVSEGSVFTIAEPLGLARLQPLPATCRERNCTASPVLRCTYIDSRGRPCDTWWCAAHLRRMGEGHYCRRHASTVTALGAKGNDPRALPPVDHRGPSLVSWIWTEGYQQLSGLISAALVEGEVVFEDHTVNVLRAADGHRRWERGWRIGDRDGITCKVMICVDEDDDATVHLKFDDAIVAQGVPPWITRRRRGDVVTAAVDSEDRRQFYAFLAGFVAKGLEGRDSIS